MILDRLIFALKRLPTWQQAMKHTPEGVLTRYNMADITIGNMEWKEGWTKSYEDGIDPAFRSGRPYDPQLSDRNNITQRNELMQLTQLRLGKDAFIQSNFTIKYGTVRALIKVGGATLSAINFTVSDVTDFHKVAVRWGADGSTIFVDGVEGIPDTDAVDFTATPLTTIDMDWVTSQSFYGIIGESGIATYNLLDSTQCVTLTTR